MTGVPKPPAADPFFLKGAKGPLFCLHHAAEEGSPVRGALLFIAPFAEEMNRSRRMVALQSKRLAALGFHVLRLDLYGTGDSGGEFGEADWDGWLDDVRRARRWLEERSGESVRLWGLRSGCLLAAEAARDEAQDAAQQAGGLLFWQPVVNGQLFLTQFLRLKVAAAMGGGERPPGSQGPSTKALRQGLLDGEGLEVAGYTLSSELARGLEAARLIKACPTSGSRVIWLEVGQGEGAAVPPASQAAIETWRDGGVALSDYRVVGPSFWAIEETTLVPALWDATERALVAP